MEKIKINSIEPKGDKGLVIIKYSDANGIDREATMNSNYQGGQNVDYVKKDVGIGGTVSVLIKQNGKYINIDEVDMTSGVKGEKIESPENQQIDARNASLMSVKDISIISQCGMKAYGTGGDRTPQQLLDCYRFFVLELEQNG